MCVLSGLLIHFSLSLSHLSFTFVCVSVCVSAACVRVWFIVLCAYHYVYAGVYVCARVWFIVLSVYHYVCVCVRASMVYSA